MRPNMWATYWLGLAMCAPHCEGGCGTTGWGFKESLTGSQNGNTGCNNCGPAPALDASGNCWSCTANGRLYDYHCGEYCSMTPCKQVTCGTRGGQTGAAHIVNMNLWKNYIAADTRCYDCGYSPCAAGDVSLVNGRVTAMRCGSCFSANRCYSYACFYDGQKTCSDSPCRAQCINSNCPNGYVKKSSPPNICQGSTCSTSECCQAAGRCSAHTCPDGYEEKQNAPNFCAGSTCTRSECCEETRGRCSAYSCPNGYEGKQNAPNFCAGSACFRSECCEETRGRCSAYSCPNGYESKQNAPNFCTGSTCTRSECCQEESRGRCSAISCPDGYTRKQNAPSSCAGATCTRSECCQEESRGRCSAISCPDGYTRKQNAPSSCAGATCTRSECCQETNEGRCSAISCPDGYTKKRNAPSSCAGTTCTRNECCQEAGPCDALTCQSDQQKKLNLPRQCSGASCARSECCEPKPKGTCGTFSCVQTHEKKTPLPGACSSARCKHSECCQSKKMLESERHSCSQDMNAVLKEKLKGCKKDVVEGAKKSLKTSFDYVLQNFVGAALLATLGEVSAFDLPTGSEIVGTIAAELVQSCEDCVALVAKAFRKPPRSCKKIGPAMVVFAEELEPMATDMCEQMPLADEALEGGDLAKCVQNIRNKMRRALQSNCKEEARVAARTSLAKTGGAISTEALRPLIAGVQADLNLDGVASEVSSGAVTACQSCVKDLLQPLLQPPADCVGSFKVFLESAGRKLDGLATPKCEELKLEGNLLPDPEVCLQPSQSKYENAATVCEETKPAVVDLMSDVFAWAVAKTEANSISVGGKGVDDLLVFPLQQKFGTIFASDVPQSFSPEEVCDKCISKLEGGLAFQNPNCRGSMGRLLEEMAGETERIVRGLCGQEQEMLQFQSGYNQPQEEVSRTNHNSTVWANFMILVTFWMVARMVVLNEVSY